MPAGPAATTRVIADGVTAVTAYEWDTKWDLPTKVTQPEGEVSETLYDSNNGNRLWQQDGRGVASRVDFGYNSFGHLQTVTAPDNTVTTLGYDALGNPASTTTPLEFVSSVHRDGIGRDTLSVSPIDGTATKRVRTFYDVVSRVDSTITYGPPLNSAPADTLVVWNVYDENGNALSVSREARPDEVGSGVETTAMTYDNANRQETVNEYGRVTTTEYDAAGNVVRSTSQRGLTTRMAYDPAGRLLRRVTPEVTYSKTNCAADCPDFYFDMDREWTFPAFPNDGNDGLLIRSDVATYTYDVMGNQLTANNRYARITRTYTDRGQVETDEMRLREVEQPDFDTYVYESAYTYDLNGRRETFEPVRNLVPGGTGPLIQSYSYDANTGMIDTLTSVFGLEYTFEYDLLNRLETYAFPGGSEVHTYDDDGRRATRVETVGGSVYHNESFTYDQRGRLTDVDGGTELSAYNRYSGLGAVVEASVINDVTGNDFLEQFTVDALGRSVSREMQNAGILDFTTGNFSFDYQAGAVTEIIEEEPAGGWMSGEYAKINRSQLDLSGNVDATVEWMQGWNGLHGGPEEGEQNWVHFTGSRNYYGGDEKLMFRQVYRDSVAVWPTSLGATGQRSGVFEEYWYDALGRRVMLRSRGRGDPQTDALCWQSPSNHCFDAQERFVWDGDQLVYEDRVRDPEVSGAPNPPEQYASVSYTHGGALDQPLDLMRSTGEVVILHTDWRGQFDSGSEPDGTQFGCQPTVYTNCKEISWAGGNLTTFLRPGTDYEPMEWYGSLISGQRDQSGLVYMRNRCYDAATGQFTQTDPIGIAGGLNVYGYANGDPVNFSDPFGVDLCYTAQCIGGGIFAHIFGARDNVILAERPGQKPNIPKFGIGLYNFAAGIGQTAGAGLVGGPLGVAGVVIGTAGTLGGASQMAEAADDPVGPQRRNVLGLVPIVGDLIDDPGELERLTTAVVDVLKDWLERDER